MGMNLSQAVAEARDGDCVAVSVTTNEDDAIASFAEGELVFHAASGGVARHSFQQSCLSTTGAEDLSMYFSDRRSGRSGRWEAGAAYPPSRSRAMPPRPTVPRSHSASASRC